FYTEERQYGYHVYVSEVSYSENEGYKIGDAKSRKGNIQGLSYKFSQYLRFNIRFYEIIYGVYNIIYFIIRNDKFSHLFYNFLP
ncbi:unnamed protein product, partial [marine sediment metagenome]